MSYLHGYDQSEAARLRSQASQLAEWVFEELPLAGCKRILEVGSGVGGQTALLCEHYPLAHITALEREPSSHACCQEWLRGQPELAARVTSVCGDAANMPAIGLHDGAHICWVLEHNADPIALLESVRSRLTPGARLAVFEVFNQSFAIAPEMPPRLRDYWAAYNEAQRRIGGDPDIGVRLGQLIHAAGFVDVTTRATLVQLDDRSPKRRAEMFAYWDGLLRSADDAIVAGGLAEAGHGREVAVALEQLARKPGVSFHYTIIRAVATCPETTC